MHNDNQPDPINIDIDRTLAALRSAAPPDGMEARILQNLDARLAQPQPTSFLRSAWLRGALTGALVATVACAALFFVLRVMPHPGSAQVESATTSSRVPHSSRSDGWDEKSSPKNNATPVALHTAASCPGAPSTRDSNGVPSERPLLARVNHGTNGWDEKSSSRVPHPSSAWVGDSATNTRTPHLIPASFAPSHPAPPVPPTAQERALIQLVRSATPAELAALSPAAEQKADAKRQADFDKFFAPSPDIVAIDEAQKKALGLTDDTPAAPAAPASPNTKEGSL